jgi:hypothetical protein
MYCDPDESLFLEFSQTVIDYSIFSGFKQLEIMMKMYRLRNEKKMVHAFFLRKQTFILDTWMKVQYE